MRPTDARIRHQLLSARRPLAWVLASGVVGSLLLVAQAFAVAGLVVAVVVGGDVGGRAALVLAVVLARSLTSWVGDVATDDDGHHQPGHREGLCDEQQAPHHP